MRFDSAAIRGAFPILKRTVHDLPLIYLDSAATTLKPQCVIDAVVQYYALDTSNVHRGVHFLSETATQAYESVRNKTKLFLKAGAHNEVIFTQGTTQSINIVAHSYGRTFLKAGDEVLISHMEHHSNIVPWQMLRDEIGCHLKVIPITDEGEIDLAVYRRMITPKTKMLAIVHISNTLGTVNPIREMINIAHEHGITVLVDGAQSVANRPVDLTVLDPDFFVFSAHKVFGPTGVGVLCGKRHYLEKMPPVQGGGDMIASVRFEKTTYNRLPYKFEAGTPNIAGVIGMGCAIDFVQQIGMDQIAQYEADLLRYTTEALQSVKGVTLIGTSRNKGPIISFILDGVHPHDIGTIVDLEGVAIRTGHHCTEPIMARYGIPATARVSLSIYNTPAEIDRLIDAIKKVKKVFQ